MAESPPFHDRLERLHGRGELGGCLRETELFRGLAPEALDWIERHAMVRRYERGEIIAREDEPTTDFHLVLNGFVKVSRRGPGGSARVITYQRDGSYFADLAFMANASRRATLTANTRCEVVELARADFDAIRTRYPSVAQAFAAAARQHAQAMASTLETTPAPGTCHLTPLLDGGVLQGHALLVIDERLCIDCNNCVDACVRRHGHPRLERRGQSIGPYLVATACRHCDDAPCLVCPVDGIVRAPDGQITITNTCIGCGACAARCPYDNIRMADKQQIAESGSGKGRFWKLLRNFARPREQGPITFEQDDLRAKVAVKCDLCVGYKDGPACVSNCPTGAAFRADGAAFFGTGEQISLLASVSRRRAR